MRFLLAFSPNVNINFRAVFPLIGHLKCSRFPGEGTFSSVFLFLDLSSVWMLSVALYTVVVIVLLYNYILCHVNNYISFGFPSEGIFKNIFLVFRADESR